MYDRRPEVSCSSPDLKMVMTMLDKAFRKVKKCLLCHRMLLVTGTFCVPDMTYR